MSSGIIDWNWYHQCELSESSIWGLRNGTWDYANSVETITSGDAELSFMVTMNTYALMGITSVDAPFDFAFFMLNDWTLHCREGTTNKYTTTYTYRDRLKLTYESGTVKYYKNDILIYTSLSSPTYTSYVRFWDNYNYRVMTHCLLNGNPIIWTSIDNCANQANMLVASGAGGDSNGKTATSNLHFRPALEDASIYKTEIRPTNESNVFGFTDDPYNNLHSNADFIFQQTNGTLYIKEKWVEKWSGSYTYGDFLKIESVSGVIKYHQNSGVVYTSATPPPDRLFPMSGLYYATYGVQEVIEYDGLYRQPDISSLIGINF